MNKVISESGGEAKREILTVFKGVVVSLSLTLILIFIFALLLTYTNISENLISPVIISITALSIFIGSSISTIKVKKNGILYGGVVGFVYIMLLYLISSLMQGSFAVTPYSMIMILAAVFGGMIGGIVGVNIR